MSLLKLDQRISAKRKALADAVDARNAAFEVLDALSDEIEALEAADGSDEKVIAAKIAEMKTARQSAFKAGDQVRALESEISDLELERSERQANSQTAANLRQPLPRQSDSDNPSAGQPRVKGPFEGVPKDVLQEDLGAYFQAAYLAKKENINIAQVLRGDVGEQFKNDRLYAATTTSNNSAVVPTIYARTLIEMLRPQSIVASLPGVRRISIPNGNLTLPRQATGGSANYLGEQVNAIVSDVTSDTVVLSAKKLVSMTPASGELMRRSDPSAMAMVRDDIINRTAEKMDITFIRNTASLSTTPKGFKHFAELNSNAGRVTASSTVNLANVTTDIGKLILKLRSVNCPFRNPVFIMSPRTERYLMDLRDGNGNLAFPEVDRGFLRQYPYRVTTQIPENLTTNTIVNCSELYFVDASEILLGETPTMELQVSTEAAYHDGSNVVAAYSQDTAVFRMIVEHDLQMRHERSVAFMEQVNWA